MSRLAKFLAAPVVLMQSVSDEVAKQRRLRLTDARGWLNLFGRSAYSGKTVNTATAMQISTVWAAIRLTAQAVSSMPLPMYEKTSNGRVSANDHPLAAILEDDPNADQTSLEFWETMVAWLCAQGNAYAEVGRGYNNRVTALNPLEADRVEKVRNEDNVPFFVYYDRGKREVLPADKVFHIRGFGFNVDCGLSPIAYGVQTLGSAIALEETIGKMYSNGMMPSGILSSDQVLKAPQREQLANIMNAYAGSERAGKLMILEAGLKYQSLTMNPVDAQMLETKRFSVEEICRWFGIPPIIVGHAAQGQTMWGSGVEQILLSWLTLGLNPLCERIERRISKQLLSPAERRRFYAEFNREALMQMDSAAKAAYLSSMTQNGLMTRNEGRSKLNLPNSNEPGADKLTVQSNLSTLDNIGQSSSSQAARNAVLNWLGDKE